MEIRQIIEALDCLTTRQHRCAGCPFNPHPGMDWPYGCGKGQAEVVKAAKEWLAAMETVIEKALEAAKPVIPRTRWDGECLHVYCPACGAELYHGQRYCENCGREMDWTWV